MVRCSRKKITCIVASYAQTIDRLEGACDRIEKAVKNLL